MREKGPAPLVVADGSAWCSGQTKASIGIRDDAGAFNGYACTGQGGLSLAEVTFPRTCCALPVKEQCDRSKRSTFILILLIGLSD
ncbi:hypothetical protein K3G39_19360 [Pontibacter sp. HSC-14F20]|uniref:hypothetical protein n=1 Tax=Pontibacter sp. HSC-14F20 TaxID=2864136 RepID=UPI001C72C17A|nr:hypothetical protein [Pontibacter sp. HSC-14F20]MBX0335399.1 hypothetical protein [Pontibacter sp. HSC-14F20]